MHRDRHPTIAQQLYLHHLVLRQEHRQLAMEIESNHRWQKIARFPTQMFVTDAVVCARCGCLPRWRFEDRHSYRWRSLPEVIAA